jgi:F0F1-type ATP synthase membrane subunit b/b'
VFAFGKMILFVIVIAIVLWFVSSFAFKWVGKILKKRMNNMKKNFKEDDIE